MERYKQLIEKLAALEHEQWMAWAKTLMDTERNMSFARKERWTGLMVPYAQLSEYHKEQDRKWARRIMKEVFHPEIENFARTMVEGLRDIITGANEIGALDYPGRQEGDTHAK